MRESTGETSDGNRGEVEETREETNVAEGGEVNASTNVCVIVRLSTMSCTDLPLSRLERLALMRLDGLLLVKPCSVFSQ